MWLNIVMETYMKKKYYISLLLFHIHIYEKLVCNKFSILHTRSRSQYSFRSSLCVVVVVCFFHCSLFIIIIALLTFCSVSIDVITLVSSKINFKLKRLQYQEYFIHRNIFSEPEYLKVLAVNYFLNDLIAMSIFCMF